MIRVQVGGVMKKPPKKRRLTTTGKYLARLKVVHNIPDDAYVAGFEKEFVALFRNEIIKRLFKGQPAKDDK